MCTCVKTFNSDFSPYIENNVHIMESHIVSTMKAHDMLKLAWWWSQERQKHVAIKNL